ncbi:hypothetical protein BGZ50_005806 [Haplosporangium sp. Z 11]|nr:hypothetical protein BGZ50_005806 [Haplosporangium sp. Z 11]
MNSSTQLPLHHHHHNSGTPRPMPLSLPLLTPDTDSSSFQKDHKVLISGAGLGGLMLGALLERAGIDYEIYEQADRYLRIGSAMAITANVFPVFEQLGILPQVIERSKPLDVVEGYNEKLKLFLPMNYHYMEKLSGYLSRIITHPDLYDILSSQVPEEKVLWGKKIISVQENDNGVSIECTDGSSYRGQIVVGADGAHSGVRECIYKALDEKGGLAKGDKEVPKYNGVCLWGETKTLNPEKFPKLRNPTSNVCAVFGDRLPYYWMTATTHRDTICWLIIQFFDKPTQQATESIRRWKSQPAGDMCEALKDLPIACGENLTLRDVMEETSRQLLSKIMHEEKFYHTWYSGRAVLIGDACHKMSPAGGLGAVNALQDATVLANCLFTLPDTPNWGLEEITDAFKAFKDERYMHAKLCYEHSHQLSQIMGNHWATEITRAIYGKTPDWLWRLMLRRIISHRPQVCFLPQIEVKGIAKPAPQPSLSRSITGSSSTIYNDERAASF